MKTRIPVYELSEQMKMIRDLPVEAKQTPGETIESLCNKKYNLTREAFYKYKRQVAGYLNKKGYTMDQLKKMTDEQIANICSESESENKPYLQNIDKEVLKEMYKDLNEKVEITEDEEQQEIIINENIEKEKKNMFKWTMIIIAVISLILVIFIFTKRKKPTLNNKTKSETKTETKKAPDLNKYDNITVEEY
ncbi:MAG: hypothetical protein IE890_00915 [Arcobacter sp.]|nr:hypothetical protein [Arcobacter sp.]